MIIVVSMLVARVLVTRVGVRPLIMAGPLLAGVGFLWLSRLSEDGQLLDEPAGPDAARQRRLGLCSCRSR